MSQATEKDKLVKVSNSQFEQLLSVMEAIPARKRTQTVMTEERDKNFRDVIIHLYEWQAMLERWYREGMAGDVPAMPAPGYKWRELKPLNEQIQKTYQDTTLNQALKKLTLSHQRVMNLIELHSDEELMTKKYYKWTKTSNLYTYFAANTVDHYNWAIAKCEAIAILIKETEG